MKEFLGALRNKFFLPIFYCIYVSATLVTSRIPKNNPTKFSENVRLQSRRGKCCSKQLKLCTGFSEIKEAPPSLRLVLLKE